MENLSCEPSVSNSVGGSGQFIDLAQHGRLLEVSSLIQGRAEIAVRLNQITATLDACNNLVSLAEFALWCGQKRKDFGLALRKKVRDCENRKSELQAKLQQIDHRLAQEHPGVDCTVDSAPITSLVPRLARKSDPYVAERNEVIDEHLDLPDQEICKLLDQNFARGSHLCCDHLPKTWALTYKVRTFTDAYRHPQCRKLVHKMISVRRHLRSYPYVQAIE